MKNRIGTFFRLLAICCGSLGLASQAWAVNPNDYLHSRTYLGILGTSVSIDTSTIFNGKNYSNTYYPNYEIDLIPKLDSNFGLGLLVGHREEAYALEISFWQSTHTASFGPAALSSSTTATPVDFPLTQGTAVVRSVNLDFKRYFLTELQSQPFLNLGVSFPWIEVPDGAVDLNGNYTTLTLAGLGLNLGVGMEYYLTPNFSLVGGVNQRWASFDQSRGFAGQFNPLTPYGGVASDGGSGLDFTLGTTIGFQ